jgi:hypothetical protein
MSLRRLVAAREFRIGFWNAVDGCGQTPLFHAMDTGNVEAVNFLLARGAEVDIRDCNGRTPLSTAAGQLYGRCYPSWENAPDLIKLLLGRGADVNTRDVDGRTPLMWVTLNKCWVRGNSPRIMNVILAHKGVEINWKAKDGLTALSIAVGMKRSEAEEILRTHGAIDI